MPNATLERPNAAAAETQQLEAAFALPAFNPREEKYAHSLGAVRSLGAVAIAQEAGTPLDAQAEAHAAIIEQQAKDNFETSLVEMLQTFEPLRHDLEILHRRRWDCDEEGFAIDKDGVRLADKFQNGADVAELAAQENPLMHLQAQRDRANVRNAIYDASLPPKKLRVTASVPPKSNDFWRGMGYRDNLVFLQWSYRESSGKLWMGSYSVEYGTVQKWLPVWNHSGGEAPDDVTAEELMELGIGYDAANIDEVSRVVLGIRDDFYQTYNHKPPKYSVEDFKAAKQQLIDQAFEQLYKPYAVAAVTGRLNGVMREFVGTLLQDTEPLNDETVQKLTRAYNTNIVDDSTARMLESAVRYGTAIGLLLDELKAYTHGGLNRLKPVARAAVPAAVLLRQMAGGVIGGARACIDLGGCTDEFKVRKKRGNTTASLQDALDSAERLMSDEHGSLTFECPDCHQENVRDPGELLEYCKFCHSDKVGCGPEAPKPQKREKLDKHKRLLYSGKVAMGQLFAGVR